jgi:hypothetical protein
VEGEHVFVRVQGHLCTGDYGIAVRGSILCWELGLRIVGEYILVIMRWRGSMCS